MKRLLLVLYISILTIVAKAQNLPYVNQTDVGLLIGDNVLGSFSAQSFNGVVIDKWKIYLGFIIGIDIYQPLTVIPLAPSIKFLPFNSKKTNPYLSLTAGYAFSGLNKFEDNRSKKGGILFNPSIGLRFKTKRKAAFNLNMGYKIQNSSITTFSNSFTVNPRLRNKTVDKYTFSRLSLTLGISF